MLLAVPVLLAFANGCGNRQGGADKADKASDASPSASGGPATSGGSADNSRDAGGTRRIDVDPGGAGASSNATVSADASADAASAGGANLGSAEAGAPAVGFFVAADISEAKQAQDRGVIYRDTDGTPGHYMDILKRHGFNMMVARVHVNPPMREGVYQTAEYVSQVFLEAKSRGLYTMLSFMYADSWSDAGNVTLPAGWPTDQAGKLATIYSYTQETLLTIGLENVDHVKIGNENDSGMLGTTNNAEIGPLMGRAFDAVKALNPSIQCSIHSTQWANWFQAKQAAGAKFDYCAISHYPMWQGNATTDLANQLASFRDAGYKVMLVETAGYYRPAPGQGTYLYPLTQAGQLQFVLDVKTQATGSPSYLGMVYWGAGWSQSMVWAPEIATSWDEIASRALFDDGARATLAIDAWR